jgi:hypothetical protein
MPKTTVRNKKTQAELPLTLGDFAVHKPRSVGDLLQSPTPRLRHLAGRARAAITLREQVRNALPETLARHVTQAAAKQQELTIWLDSGAFCARLRFEIPRIRAALGAALGTPIERVRVRVQPGK